MLAQPPAGCSIDDTDQVIVVSASLRSVPAIIGIGAFSFIWNSILSVFVLIAIAGLYANLIGPLPDWFPAPELQDGKPRMNNGPMGLGMTLFLCIFLFPFVLVGIGSLATLLLYLFGKVQVQIAENESFAALGISPFRWKCRFDASDVRSVKCSMSNSNSGDTTYRELVVTTNRPLTVTNMLPKDQMEWLRIVLKEVLLNPGEHRYRSILPYPTWIPHRREQQRIIPAPSQDEVR
jgi:hypothetical protein